VQALGALSGGTTLDFATELGVRIRFLHSLIAGAEGAQDDKYKGMNSQNRTIQSPGN
jgi:hypothetical protein